MNRGGLTLNGPKQCLCFVYFILFQAYLCCESLRRRLMKRQRDPLVAGQFVQLIDFWILLHVIVFRDHQY